MPEKTYRVYAYRWVVLTAFMLINLTIQLLWISYAPVTGPAAQFYGVDDLKIGLLAMTFMLAFIPLSIQVSWAIDTYGFRLTVSIGAVLMGIFGVVRGLAGADYNLVLISTIGIAVAQPFLLNAWTKLPAQWFSIEERATAVGLVTLANLVGTALGMVLTPILFETMPLPTIQLIYGAVAAFAAILFVLLAREKPATPPCEPGQEVRALSLDGFKHALKVREFWLYLAVFFGAIILPPISDRLHKRQPFILAGFVTAIPALLGVTFATSAWLLFTSAFLLGFTLVSVAPIGMQYASEITYPTPEGTSNGLIQLFGQVSVVFVYIMEALRTASGAFTPAMLLAVVLLVVGSVLIRGMKDPKLLAVK